MRITNYTDLPEPIVNAIRQDYQSTPDRYSITTIEQGVREVLLSRRYEDQLEMDAADGIWALLGRLMHKVLEEAKETSSQLKEEFITLAFPYYKGKGFLAFGEIPNKDDIVERVITVSGQFDLYDESSKELTDYKLTSSWSYVFGGKAEWRKQLAGYAWMMKTLGFPVERGQNIIVYRDWNRGVMMRSKDYPRRACQVIKYEFRDQEFEAAYNNIIAKFADILKYENTPDDQLPVCTNEERWAKETTFAVMKKGRVKAMRVLKSEPAAVAYMAEKGGDEVVMRKGESTKCKHYCSCNHFCSFWKENYEAEEIAEEAAAQALLAQPEGEE